MDHADHVRLLRDGVTHGGTWADLGAGAGAFTLALAELVGPGGEVIAVDRDGGALRELERAVRRDGATVRTLSADFTKPLDLETLDGVVMANSLHFVKEKAPMLARVLGMLRADGRLVLVEYDTDHGNAWVPYPISFETWSRVAVANGFAAPRLLATVPSRFLRRMYAAMTTPSA